MLLAEAAHRMPEVFPREAGYTLLLLGEAARQAGGPDPARGILVDCAGENISRRNPHFCELTGLYWLWRSSGAEAVGLCHYRRFFAGRPLGSFSRRVLTREQAETLLQTWDLVLPRKRHYWIETTFSQYAHAHHAADLEAVRAILCEQGDGRYVAAFDRVMGRRSGHRFNMLLARRPVLEAYCAWLFPVLFALEERLDIRGYTAYDQRVFGFVAERLLDVWLEVAQVRWRELPVLYTESQRWPLKIARFLLRKLRARQEG